jgi:L-ascorbate metabolism protein UlaG (beta-lactamase superfamily)
MLLLALSQPMTDTSFIKNYRSNPNLKTVHSPAGWKRSPVDKNGRFLNLEFPFTPSLAKVIRWKLQRNPLKKEKDLENWNPKIFDDTSWLKESDDIIVWLGHCTYYIRINGVRILTDPVFEDVLTIKRKTKLPVNPRLLKDIDLVLLSHDHRDHTDKESLRLLIKQNPNLCIKAGLGSEKLLQDLTTARNIETAAWYQQFGTGQQPVNITFIPSRHWAKRGIFDTNKRLWGGFVIEAGNKRILFGGDSGYDSHFKQLGKLFGPFDYAIIGIGAYQPNWFMSPMHMSPFEAVTAFQNLKAKYLIPMHYGTFDLSDEPLSLPLKVLVLAADQRLQSGDLQVLDIGFPKTI